VSVVTPQWALNVKRALVEVGQRHCVYLLQGGARFYVGFTVYAPWYRVLQHNGIAIGGAVTTQTSRPWRVVCFVTGFPTPQLAKRFERQWQLGYRGPGFVMCGGGRARPGVHGKMQILLALLHTPLWSGVSSSLHAHAVRAHQGDSRAVHRVASVVWERLSTSVSFGTLTVCAHGPVDAVEWERDGLAMLHDADAF
jgi:hypothetical protein